MAKIIIEYFKSIGVRTMSSIVLLGMTNVSEGQKPL